MASHDHGKRGENGATELATCRANKNAAPWHQGDEKLTAQSRPPTSHAGPPSPETCFGERGNSGE
jgi:hypothetical protein